MSGMKVTITIVCETNDEVETHLIAIRKELNKAFKKDESFTGTITDNNCYGDHTVTVEEV